MEALADGGARVLLIGTGQHAEGSGLDPLPTVERSVRDMGDALIERCGLGWDRLRIVLDAVTPTEIGLALAEEAECATSLLMIYYVGHGLVGLGGELYLATRATDARPGWLAHTALAYNAVRNSLLESPATSLIVVLDCCYSGRAIGVLGSSQSEAANLAQVYGAFVLTSAASNELALAPEGAAHTKFTGEFLNLLLNGDSRGPEQLTLHDIYTHLARALPASGGPLPRYVSSGRADDLVLASNPAYQRRARRRPEPPGPDVCPYPGLAAFEPQQAKWFFGREPLTAELAARVTGRLAEGTPLVVVAPSGAGKSSLLRAGLVPAIAGGALAAPGSHNWPRLMMTPGAHPFAALAGQLAPLLSGDSAAIADDLAREPARSAGLFREVLGSLAADGDPAGARVILIVDQLEELFTLCTDESERRAFIDQLGVLASGTPGADPAGLLVLGLRADFYGRCAAFPQLRDAVQRDQVLVGPMSAGELREAIERPAQAVGLELEPGLVELLLRDIGASDGRAGSDGEPSGTVPGAYEPGRLPLIAYALQATWDQRTGRTLTVAGYQETGGIQHAIATAANRTFDALPEESQAAAHPLFLRLVKIGDGTQDTRRSVSEEELLQHSRSRAAGERVLAAFVEARLLTSNQHGIEISHEALLHAWPRLAQWISTDRAGNLLGQEVEDAAAAWERSGRDSSDLFRGPRLEAAAGWAAEHGQDDVSPITQTFLRESKRQQNRSSHLRRTAVAVLAVLALVAAGTAWFALGQRNSAEASSRVAILSQVTSEANQVSSTDQSLAAELNVLAYRMKPSAATYTRLISAANTPLSSVLPVSPGTPDSVAFSPSGRILAVGTSSGARLWNVSTLGRALPLSGPLTTGTVASVAFSPDGRTVAIGTSSGVQLWDVASPAHPRSLGPPLGAGVSSVAFSPDGGTLAIGTSSGVQLWDVASPAYPRSLGPALGAQGITNPRLAGGPVPTATDAVASVAFSASGSTLGDAIGSSIQLWNVSDPAHPRLFGTPLGPLPYADGRASVVDSLAFSSNGTLAAGAADHEVHLWDVANPAEPVSYGWVLNDTDSVTSVAFSSDGDVLATGSDDDTASLWNVTSPGYARLLYSSLAGHTGAILAVAMSPDGRVLATAGADHAIRLWTLPGAVMIGHSNYVDTLAVSRARGIAASGSPDDTIRLWNVANPAHPASLGRPLVGPAQYDALSFSPNGLILAAATSADDVQLWQTAEASRPTLLGAPLTGFSAYVSAVAFSPNGHVLAAGSDDHTIRLWDVANPALPASLGAPLTGPSGMVSSVAFSPDGRTLAAGSLDGTVRLWNVANPANAVPLGRPLTDGDGGVYSIAFSPDGRTLASGDADGTVHLWDVRDPARATALGAPLAGDTDTVSSVAFSPDGGTLATGSWDDTIRLWDVADPARPRAIGGPVTGDPNYINAVAFGPGDSTLIAGDGDDTVRIWNLSAAAAIQHICAATVNVLTRSQWHRYVSELPYDPPCGAGR